MKSDYCVINKDILNINREILYDYLETLKFRFTEQTICSHKRILENFLLDQTKDIEFLEPNDVLSWLSVRYNSTPSTFNKALGILRQFFTICQDEGHIKKNPVKDWMRRRIPKSVPKHLSQYELALVQLHSANLNLKERAIVEFVIATGCQSSVICALNIEDIDFHKCEAIVTRARWNRRSIIIFSMYARILIQEYLKNHPSNENALFLSNSGKRITPRAINDIIHRLGKITGLEETFTLSHLRNTAKFRMEHNTSLKSMNVRSNYNTF